MRALACLSALALAVPALAQPGDETRMLKERIERLEAENEALKDLVVKLKREAKAGGGGDDRAALDRLCRDMTDPKHADRSARQINGRWYAQWSVPTEVAVKDYTREVHLPGPLAQVTWTMGEVSAGPFDSKDQATAAEFPAGRKVGTFALSSKYLAILEGRAGQWRVRDVRVRTVIGEYVPDKFMVGQHLPRYLSAPLAALKDAK